MESGAVGSNLHTEAIQREFNLSFENAERLKRGESVENVSPEDAFSVLESASEEIIGDISRSFEFYRSTETHQDINEVILSGGCTLIRDFPRLFSDKIGIEAKIIEPFRNIKIPNRFDVSYIEEVAPIAAVATGLALRRPGDR